MNKKKSGFFNDLKRWPLPSIVALLCLFRMIFNAFGQVLVKLISQYNDALKMQGVHMEFDIVEDFCVDSEVTDATVKVMLRRLRGHKPTRFFQSPYFLDLSVGGILQTHYGVDEVRAREAVMRFLLKYVNGIAPPLQ